MARQDEEVRPVPGPPVSAAANSVESGAGGDSANQRASGASNESPTAAPAPEAPPQFSELSAKLDRLLHLVNNRLAYDAGKEDMIQRMGQELAAYRDDFFRRRQRPLLLDLVLLYFSLQTVRQDLLRRETLTPQAVDEKLAVLGDELLEALARQEVEPLSDDPGILDPRCHRTVRVEPTTDPAEHNRVVTVVRPGFSWGDGILRPTDVVVKKLETRPS